MKKYFGLFLLAASSLGASAQETIYPAPPNKGVFFITNGTVHIGNGQVIEHCTIKINNGKIDEVGTSVKMGEHADSVLDAQGKQIYPGLILPDCDLGLKEISGAVRGTNDFSEIGEQNPSVRSIVAYNTDSKIINTLRSNGILLANIVPQGGYITGTSSVVQLDAWNYEDALYAKDNGMHISLPGFIVRPRPDGVPPPPKDPIKEALDKVEEIKKYFRDAKAYLAEKTHADVNLKLEAARPLFEKKQKLFVNCDEVKQMLIAIDFNKEFGFEVVIVGGSESWQIAPLLKQNNIAVILTKEHRTPVMEDDDIDQPFKTPAALQKAGVLFALNDDDETTRYRNLPFNAGTAASYGLTKEQALTAITLSTATILGIADKTGSIEVGKDANIVISEGDILDMKTSIITHAFIQGRTIDLNNKQTQLFERYKYKYGIK